ncbi:MAG: polysaccharide biosynthesis/export family protein, partial [Verrucomicrobiota bacterium]
MKFLLFFSVLALALTSVSCKTTKPITPAVEAQILAAKSGTTKAPDENYRLSSGDTIGVDLFRRSDLKAVMQLPKVAVAADGKIVLPHVGGIVVADQTIEEASTTVRDAYSSHMIEP